MHCATIAILVDGFHGGEEVEVLKDHPHLPADGVDVRLGVGDVHAVEGDAPLGGGLQQVQAPQKGGLARAGRPDDHHLLPGVDVLGNVVQDQVGPKGLGEMFNVDHFAAASFPVCSGAR